MHLRSIWSIFVAEISHIFGKKLVRTKSVRRSVQFPLAISRQNVCVRGRLARSADVFSERYRVFHRKFSLQLLLSVSFRFISGRYRDALAFEPRNSSKSRIICKQGIYDLWLGGKKSLFTIVKVSLRLEYHKGWIFRLDYRTVFEQVCDNTWIIGLVKRLISYIQFYLTLSLSAVLTVFLTRNKQTYGVHVPVMLTLLASEYCLSVLYRSHLNL